MYNSAESGKYTRISTFGGVEIAHGSVEGELTLACVCPFSSLLGTGVTEDALRLPLPIGALAVRTLGGAGLHELQFEATLRQSGGGEN